DVEQAGGFDVFGGAVELPQVVVGGFIGASGFLDGGEQQRRGSGEFLPSQQRRGAGPGHAVQAGDDDGAEFQAFGLVDGHDLQVGVGGGLVGLGVELVEQLGEAREVDFARFLELFQGVQVD